MAMSGSSFFTIARIAKVVALLFFLLPFVTVSCSSRDFAAAMSNGRGPAADSAMPSMPGMEQDCVLISASGLQLALGSAELSRSCFGALADMDPRGSQKASSDNGPFSKSDVAVIGAAAALLLALLLGFLLKGAAGPVIGIIASAGAIGAVAWSIFFRIPDAVFSGPAPAGGGQQLSAEQARQILSVNPGIGFWLMAAALLAAILCCVLALSKGKAAPASAVTAPQPPAEPPAAT